MNKREKNNELYIAMQGGDDNARQALIVNNMPLVLFIVRRLSDNANLARHTIFQRLFDDLVSEGNLALTIVVNKLSEKKIVVDNFTNYIAQAISNAITKAVNDDAQVGPRSDTQLRHARQGKESKVRRRASAVTHEHRFEEGEIEFKDYEDNFASLSHSESLADLRDLIDACCENEYDLAVVAERANGLVDAEVADRLEISTATVHRIRNRIEERFNDSQTSA